MSKPQLYIKNEKGRYEPYKLPEPEVDNKLYRKINGKCFKRNKRQRKRGFTAGAYFTVQAFILRGSA